MITSRQIRGARGLLGWSQQKLADKAVLSLTAVARLERGKGSHVNTLAAVEKVLLKAGIEFISGGGKGEGVRLLKP